VSLPAIEEKLRKDFALVTASNSDPKVSLHPFFAGALRSLNDLSANPRIANKAAPAKLREDLPQLVLTQIAVIDAELLAQVYEHLRDYLAQGTSGVALRRSCNEDELRKVTNEKLVMFSKYLINECKSLSSELSGRGKAVSGWRDEKENGWKVFSFFN
jgi:hypothetical protein